MGGIIQSIFGGSSSNNKSQSNNQAYPWAQQNFGAGSSAAFNGGLGMMGNILTGNSQQSQNALNNFWNSTGGQFQLNQGINDVNANMAARGLGTSGADMKGLEDYRSGLASTTLNNYLGDLGNYAKLGLGGGSLITDAGQQSSASGSGSQSSGGLGQFLGQALPMLAFM